MIVSEYDTAKSSFPKLPISNKVSPLYARQMGFKDRLRSARKAQRLSGEYVGSQLGVSKQTISHWEAGRYEPNIDQIKGLCSVLKVTPNYLFEVELDLLPPDAMDEARAYAALGSDDRKRWKTIRKAMFSTAGT